MELRKITPPSTIVLTVDRGEPVVIYYGPEKGWHFLPLWGDLPSDGAQAIRELEELRAEGATFMVFNQYTLWWLDYYQDLESYLDKKYRPVSVSVEYLIYDISAQSANRLSVAAE